MKFPVTFSTPNKSSILSSIYFLLTALVALSRIFDRLTYLDYLCKPLLMPILGAIFVTTTLNYNSRFYWVLFALLFSWLGDVLLLFEPQHELFFIGGLSAFLIAHLFYIFVFRLDVKNFNLLKSKPYISITLLLFLFGFLYLLQPNLNELLLPVSVYAIIICTMLLFAILRYGQVGQASFQLSFIGALLFVLSDSVIAINKFLMSFNWAYSLIIVLYAVGQYYLVKGIVVKN